MDKDFLDFYFNPTKNTEGETELTLGNNGSFDDYITGLLLKQGNMNSNTPGGVLKDKGLASFNFPKGTNRSMKKVTFDSPLGPIDVPENALDNSFISNVLTKGLDMGEALKAQLLGAGEEIQSAGERKTEKKFDGAPPGRKEEALKKKKEINDKSSTPEIYDIRAMLEELNIVPTEDDFKKQKEANERIRLLNTPSNSPGGTGDKATGGNKSKEKKSDSKKEDDFEITLKDKPEPPSKIGMILNNLMSESPTFLTEIAKSLLAGKGLVPGIIEGSEKERDVDLATKKAAGAARSQSILDALNQAKAREALRPDEVIENANLYATQLGYPEGSEDYKKAFDEMVRLQVQNSGSGSQLANLITASTLAGGDLSKVGQDFLNNNPMGGNNTNNTNNTNTTNGPEVIKGYTLS
tara:strand:+ start:1836 stop:3062 length:1227 start_codon:yes stop_codon:yes gene_type:complete